MLTVISWFRAHWPRKPVLELVQRELGAAPTLFAILADRYTNEDDLRPFVPLSEQLGDRMHFLLLTEWPQEQRERDGEVVLRTLGLAQEARRLLLRDDGDTRYAVVLRQKQPVALINLFFRERRRGLGDRAEQELCAWEEQALEKLESLLTRLPPQPPRALQEGEHDWLSNGLCRRCGQGVGTLLACGTRRVAEDGPRRDRFELIELD